MVTPLDQRPRSGPYSGINARSAKRFLAEQFRQAGLPFPDEDAKDLVLAATELSETEFITRGTEFLSPDVFERVSDYAARRLSGEPVDHILGAREFYGLTFKVSRDVLSPRQDTEVLVREALKRIADLNAPKILDLGTGSGAILISLLHARQDTSGTGVDLSEAALSIAKENAIRHGVNADWRQGSWLEPVIGIFDLIVSNPPYITANALEGLEKEVRDYDPDLALRGGADGLAAYRAILSDVHDYLAPNGWVLFEIGYDQGDAVSAMMAEAEFTQVAVIDDLSGQNRVVIGRKSG